jgi:hypothetical protein
MDPHYSVQNANRNNLPHLRGLSSNPSGPTFAFLPAKIFAPIIEVLKISAIMAYLSKMSSNTASKRHREGDPGSNLL